MNRNVIISAVGNNGLYKGWLGNDANFDLVLLYYGNDKETFDKLKSDGYTVVNTIGSKFHLIKDFITNNKDYYDRYDNFWFPDDDLETNCYSINKLFSMHEEFKLWLSQPSILGYTSHDITKPNINCILRYTDFVEIMCPLMTSSVLKKLLDTFDLSESGWGVDIIWNYILGCPQDKIAIIDEVSVTHTRQPGTDYSRFKNNPHDELRHILNVFSVPYIPSRNIKCINK